MKNPETLTIELEAGATITALAYEPEGTSRRALILAHGAGAGQRSAFMVAYARALAGRGIETFTFNFPYTEHGRRIPDRRPVLEECYRAVVAAVHVRTPQSLLFIGGKSMGGRIATHVTAADPALAIAGLVLLGYPLHPPGRPTDRRDTHLPQIHRPTLIVQGSRDAFGTPGEFQAVVDQMSPTPTIHVVDGGDHSFKVPGGATKQTAVQEDVQRVVAEWIMRMNATA